MIPAISIYLAKAGNRHYARIWLGHSDLIATGRGNSESEAIRDAVQDCRAGRYTRCRARELEAAIARDEELRDIHEQHQEDLAVDEWRGAH